MNDQEIDRMGVVLRDGDNVSLRYVRELKHPPEKVWAALTESQHLRAWMPIDLIGERAVGANLSARFWPDFVAKYGIDQPDLPAEILVWSPPNTLEWRWDQDILRFELTACSVGTRLVFTTKLDTREVPGHKTGAGYHLCLNCLDEYLDTQTLKVSLLERNPETLEARYAEKFTA
jgi:uncharacterized protein YndB with AHSA1/START domain